ncbi:hypothetical protein NQ317_016007 [Molorchus minor]|uniref:Uncharacterized protein n=1 Tax=Molorchus minor TaxID=1323400 RepID=A0ABQ9JY13_9CUCU|nr:hypothetical protein NQ317_016007 [Molorchus minor]
MSKTVEVKAKLQEIKIVTNGPLFHIYVKDNIGALCPANIKLQINKGDGTCKALVTKTHVGNIKYVILLLMFQLEFIGRRHTNDAVSVESWVNEMQEKSDAILFHKMQDSLVQEWPELKSEDYMLAIMTDDNVKC